MKPFSIYCSFAPADVEMLSAVETALEPLETENLINMWHVGKLLMGMEATESDALLATADAILILCSPNYVASDRTFLKELPAILARQERDAVPILPVLIEAVNWRATPLGGFSILPSNGVPILNHHEPAAAWMELASKVARIARPYRIFVVSSREDLMHCERFRNHLSSLQLTNEVAVRSIPWENLIEAALEKELRERTEWADLLLVLLSADYLADDRLYEIVLRTDLERPLQGPLLVGTVLIRPTDLSFLNETNFSLALPVNQLPVYSHKEPSAADAARAESTWTDITKQIAEHVRSRRGGSHDITDELLASRPQASRTLWRRVRPAKVLVLSAGPDDVSSKLVDRLSALERDQLIGPASSEFETYFCPPGAIRFSYVEKVDVILILLNADLLGGYFLRSEYLIRALQRHYSGEALVILLHVSPCYLPAQSPLWGLPSLPSNGQEITLWTDQEDAWIDIESHLREWLEGAAPLDRNVDLPVRGFVLHHHEDVAFANELKIHLALLERRGLLTLSTVADCVPGENLDDWVSNKIQNSSLILPLLSGSFLANKKSYTELGHVLECYEKDRATVIPVLVGPANLKPHQRLRQLRLFPHNGIPITKWSNQSDAWLRLSALIERIIVHGENFLAAPPLLFYAYAASDEESVKALEKHLSSMVREGLIRSWNERFVGPGENKKEMSDSKLREAEIVLFLLSADFISECGELIERALHLNKSRRTKIIPVVVRAVDWKLSPFGDLMPLPRNGKAVRSWSDPDEAWLEVVEGIRAAIEPEVVL